MENTATISIGDDPLAHPDSSSLSQQQNSNAVDDDDDDNTTKSTTKEITYNTPEELLALVSERLVVERTPEEDEMVDPIERAVRFLVPIPKHYYWDVVVGNEENADLQRIPTRIKLWHRCIAASVSIGDWTNQTIAQPVANAMGLTGSRFHYVTDLMSEQDMQESKRVVLERSLRDQEMKEIGGGSSRENASTEGNVV